MLMQWIQGFGVTARSTAESRKLEPTAVVLFRQGDVGEYLREVRQPLLDGTEIRFLTRKDYRKIPCSRRERPGYFPVSRFASSRRYWIVYDLALGQKSDCIHLHLQCRGSKCSIGEEARLFRGVDIFCIEELSSWRTNTEGGSVFFNAQLVDPVDSTGQCTIQISVTDTGRAREGERREGI